MYNNYNATSHSCFLSLLEQKILILILQFTLLMRGKVPTKNEVLKTIAGIIQSTAFLAWSGFSYSMFICLLRYFWIVYDYYFIKNVIWKIAKCNVWIIFCYRNYVTNYNFLTVSFLPSFLSSLTAIILERPSRRTLLCLYVSNIVS